METSPGSPLTDPVKAKKAHYYQDSETVEQYDHRRFQRGGGAFVARKEAEIIGALIMRAGLKAGLALDCPCGTGRFIPLLKNHGLEVLAADLSKPMLALARRHAPARCLQASADRFPLAGGTIQLWLMSRFCFHFSDPFPFVQEAARLLSPGGVLLLDVYHWTPRAWIPGKQEFLGGRTFLHGRNQVEGWADRAGFLVVAEIPVFAVAPYLYGFLPLWLVKGIETLSDSLAPRFKAKSYFLLRRRSDSGNFTMASG